MKKIIKNKKLKVATKSLIQYLKGQYPTKAARQKADDSFNRLSLGYTIYQARKQRGFTQLDLAKKISTTQSEVARIEGGDQNVTTEKLNKIAKALDRKLEILLI